VVAAIEAGVPVGGYWHWTLADNYEWGSYEPRFGLYGVDRERGLRWSELDSMGVDAAGAYRRLATGLRQGDRSVLSADLVG
jgi:beta-glucosidase/6-phospho-beta-glucosidase/beta-galactosidase